MAVPKQILKQSEDAQRLQAELAGEDSSDVVEETATDVEQAGNEGETVQSDSVAESAPESSGREHGTDSESKTYEQRYKTLQGMYNADTSRLRATNSQYEERIAQMEQLLASLSSGGQSGTTQPEATTTQKYVTDDDVAEYGDSIDMMRRVSREEMASVSTKLGSLERAVQQLTVDLKGSVLPQVQTVARQQAMSREDKFWSDLSSRVPDWQKVNNDSTFQSWLLEVDPLTGYTRQSFLERAQRDLDVNRVVAFFNAFTLANGTPVDTNAQPSRSASELEKQVSPGRSRGTGAPTSQNAKSYTPDDIRKFFADVQRGKYKGRESERDRIERDIFAAQREGRITQ